MINMQVIGNGGSKLKPLIRIAIKERKIDVFDMTAGSRIEVPLV